jgi:predicted RNA binding protein YcfA (HicA-like mRNA interferase family)
MSKLPALTGTALISILKKIGFTIDRQSFLPGAHEYLFLTESLK